jgi:hypothetical protein
MFKKIKSEGLFTKYALTQEFILALPFYLNIIFQGFILSFFIKIVGETRENVRVNYFF